MDYLTIYLYGSIFVEISLGLNSFITAQGDLHKDGAVQVDGQVVHGIADGLLRGAEEVEHCLLYTSPW